MASNEEGAAPEEGRLKIPGNLDAKAKIEYLAKQTMAMARREVDPFVDIPSRTLSNVTFSKRRKIIEMGDATQRRSLFNLNQARKYMQTLLIARGCTQLLDEQKTASIRDLYYMTKHTLADGKENTFDGQEESDPIIEDLEVTLGTLREELHLFAAKRGSVVGPLTLVDAGDVDRPLPHGFRRLVGARHRRTGHDPLRRPRRQVHPPGREGGRLGRASTRTSSGSATTASSSPARASRRAASAACSSAWSTN